MSARFDAEIRQGRGGGAYVEVPDDAVETLGGGGRIKVRARFDGVDYRGSIARMGGVALLGVVKEIRERIGKGPGDRVTVTVAIDSEERTVTTPPELATLLEDAPAAREFYDTLSYTCRKEYAQWVGEAKRPETRERRAAKAVEMLARGEKR